MYTTNNFNKRRLSNILIHFVINDLTRNVFIAPISTVEFIFITMHHDRDLRYAEPRLSASAFLRSATYAAA